MIIKVKGLKRPDFDRVIRYILNDTSGDSFVLKHNLRGRKMTDWIQEFKDNEATYRTSKRKNATILTHEIMSFSQGDNQYLTQEILQDFARQYINLRGKEGLALAVPHFDKDHTHIHFCFSGIKYKSAQSMRMSKAEFKSIKQSIQQYQLDRYPELSHSIVWHGKGEQALVNDREYRVIKRGRESNKQKVRRLVAEARRKTQTEIEMYESLKEQGIIPYHRGGKVAGVIFNGRKYRWRVLGEHTKEATRVRKTLKHEHGR